MAKKPTPAKKSSPSAKVPVRGAVARSKAPVSTPVRNSAVPPKTSRKEITHEVISLRAYEISISGTGASESDNWLRAERELRGGR